MKVRRIADRSAWRAFTEALDALSDDEVRALERSCEAWPDALRSTPGRWLRRLLDGEDEPRLRFTRSLEHVLFPEPARRARLAWASTPWLAELTTLRLDDGALGDEGARAFGRSPHLQNLRALSLSFGMTADGVAALVGENTRQVRDLRLARNRIGARGVARLAGAPRLEALHLGRNALDDEALDALPAWPRLARLDLDCNAFTGAGLERLCASGRLAGVRELNLSNNRIGRRGCDALARAPDLASLEVLFLHGCDLEDDDVRELLAAPWLRRLKNLALSENRLSMVSVERLAQSAESYALGELDVCHNRFDPTRAEVLLRASPQLERVTRFCT